MRRTGQRGAGAASCCSAFLAGNLTPVERTGKTVLPWGSGIVTFALTLLVRTRQPAAELPVPAAWEGETAWKLYLGAWLPPAAAA